MYAICVMVSEILLTCGAFARVHVTQYKVYRLSCLLNFDGSFGSPVMYGQNRDWINTSKCQSDKDHGGVG
jgi:hypothetical protein